MKEMEFARLLEPRESKKKKQPCHYSNKLKRISLKNRLFQYTAKADRGELTGLMKCLTLETPKNCLVTEGLGSWGMTIGPVLICKLNFRHCLSATACSCAKALDNAKGISQFIGYLLGFVDGILRLVAFREDVCARDVQD